MESDVRMRAEKRIIIKLKMSSYLRPVSSILAIACALVMIGSVQTSDANGFVNLDEYYRMPKIYDYDDYDRCVAQAPHLPAEDVVYCVARTIIKPDQESSLWRLIENFTNDTKRHFRHDHLDRGF